MVTEVEVGLNILIFKRSTKKYKNKHDMVA